MNLKEYFLEMSYHKKKAETIVEGLNYSIKQHVLYLIYFDNSSRDHWINEILASFGKIDDIVLKSKNKKMKESKLFKILYEELWLPLNENKWVRKIENIELKNINRIINFNLKMDEVRQMYKDLCYDLHNDVYEHKKYKSRLANL